MSTCVLLKPKSKTVRQRVCMKKQDCKWVDGPKRYYCRVRKNNTKRMKDYTKYKEATDKLREGEQFEQLAKATQMFEDVNEFKKYQKASRKVTSKEIKRLLSQISP